MYHGIAWCNGSDLYTLGQTPFIRLLKNTMGHSGKKKGTQAMHLPGQKQCRTTGAATMQEKETLVVQAKKKHSNSHNQIEEKTGAKPAKKPTSRL